MTHFQSNLNTVKIKIFIIMTLEYAYNTPYQRSYTTDGEVYIIHACPWTLTVYESQDQCVSITLLN